MSHTEFDMRMKRYENANKLFLLNQSPVIIRVDGRAFHTFTRGMAKPFDQLLSDCMNETAQYLLDHVSNCVFAYTQSDEISLLLVDYATTNTSAWFENNQQKLASISASMATLVFNRAFEKYLREFTTALSCVECSLEDRQRLEKLRLAYSKAHQSGAMFDARAFNLPKEEIVNYFIWRQQDATRNSIQMVAQANFSHKRLQNKNTKQLQEMLMSERGINWNDTPVKFKRGVAIYKKETMVTCERDGITTEVMRKKSFIDTDMPKLTADRDFIKRICPYAY